MRMPSLREAIPVGAEGDGGEGAAVHLELEVAAVAVVGADLPDPLDRRRPLPERPHDAVRPCKNKVVVSCKLKNPE